MKFKVNIISNVATKKFIKSLTKGIKKIKLANIPKTAYHSDTLICNTDHTHISHRVGMAHAWVLHLN